MPCLLQDLALIGAERNVGIHPTPHFSDKETQIQREKVTWPVSQPQKQSPVS